MNTTEVDLNAATPDEERLTYHLFDHTMEPFTAFSGQATHIPSTDAKKSQWPPPSLFEAIYGSAVVFHFGTLPVGFLRKWETVFYGNGPGKAGQAGDKH